MTGWIAQWLPWIPPMLLPGIVNLLVAYQNRTDLDEGLNWLKGYFASDIRLKNSPNEQAERAAEVDRALAQRTDREKVDAAIALVLKVRGRDCQGACKRFGCSNKFLQTYFPGR